MREDSIEREPELASVDTQVNTESLRIREIGVSFLNKISAANDLFRYNGLEPPSRWNFDLDPQGSIITPIDDPHPPRAAIVPDPINLHDSSPSERVMYLSIFQMDEDGEQTSEEFVYSFHFDLGNHDLKEIKTLGILDLSKMHDEEEYSQETLLEYFKEAVSCAVVIRDRKEIDAVGDLVENLWPRAVTVGDGMRQLLSE